MHISFLPLPLPPIWPITSIASLVVSVVLCCCSFDFVKKIIVLSHIAHSNSLHTVHSASYMASLI